MTAFSYDPQSRRLTCELEGRMDAAGSAALQQEIDAQLAAHAQDGPQLALHLHQVNFISSAFLRTCLSLAKRVGIDKFTICGCAPFVKKIFVETGFDKQLNVS